MNELDKEFKEIIDQQIKNGFKFDIEKARNLYMELYDNPNNVNQRTIDDRQDLLLTYLNYAELEPDSRIRGEVVVNGSVTGRCSHKNPNVASTPSSKKPYGKEFRELFTVEEGNKLLGIDAKGLELRLLAHYMNDKEYIETILSGDIHEYNRVKADLDTRDDAKTFIYTFLYGGGEELIGSKIRKDKTQKQKNIALGRIKRNTFLSSLPNLLKLKSEVEKSFDIEVLDGSYIKSEEKYKNLNILLQTAGSIVMKRFLVYLFHLLKDNGIKDYKFVGNFHDEIQIEVNNNDIDIIKNLAKSAIIMTSDYYDLNCPLDIEIKSGNNWYETH